MKRLLIICLLIWAGLEGGFILFDMAQDNITAEFDSLHDKTRDHIEEIGL